MNELENTCIKILKPSDFENNSPYLLKNKKSSFVLFYTDWCQYCQNIKPEYINFSNIVQFINICSFNCEENEIILKKLENENLLKIKSYPTIIIFKNGKPYKEYKGKRETIEFIKYAMNICKHD